MQRLQLYIEDYKGDEVLIDMFDDETIQLTSTIQDVKDIGKVFTDYSQTFSVPASETNNKVFRHFYNFNITGNAFDARKKKKAKLHINYAPFREGKIFLNSVKMKNNKAYAYEIIFYGKTVSLKDLLGDDELTDLSYLQNYNHQYSESNVRDGLTNGLDLNGQTDSVIYPLITSRKRLFFNSDNPVASGFYNASGNIYHDESNLPSSADTDRGLEYTDLKPALKVIHIIEAIEDNYNLSFTRDFFSSNAFDNLYMWLNSREGELNEVEDGQDYSFGNTISSYSYVSGSTNIITINNGIITTDLEKGGSYNFEFRLTTTETDIPYKVRFKNTETGYEQLKSGIGNRNIDFEPATTEEPNNFIIEVLSESEFSYDVELLIEFNSQLNQTSLGVIYETTSSQTTIFDLDLISEEASVIPKMKVIDFLTGLFKMFNLTAYFIDDLNDDDYGKIYVDTLDNYYLDAVNNRLGGLIDLDKYVDSSEHTVDSVLPFTDINFNYQETDTVLMENHFEQFNEVFGDAEFNVRDGLRDPITGEIPIDRGTKYDISLPFSHMKYERLIDLGLDLGDNATTSTLIQWGYCAGGEFKANQTDNTGDYDSTLIEPLLFYAIKVSNLPDASNANSYRGGKINWISTSPPTGLTSYWRPSNSSDTGNSTTPPTYSLNFDQESDEWQGINYGPDSNSLYHVFYKSYVESVFNPLKRMFRVKAFLPPNIVINYRLNDQIKIQDKIFRINSITTDLMTGESEIELLNIFSNEIVG